MATHSSVPAWRIPWTVQSMGSQRVGHDWASFTHSVPGHCANQFIVNYTVKLWCRYYRHRPPPQLLRFKEMKKSSPMSWSGSFRTQVLLYSKSRLLTIMHIISQAAFCSALLMVFLSFFVGECSRLLPTKQNSVFQQTFLPLQQISYQVQCSPPSILVPLQTGP